MEVNLENSTNYKIPNGCFFMCFMYLIIVIAAIAIVEILKYYVSIYS